MNLCFVLFMDHSVPNANLLSQNHTVQIQGFDLEITWNLDSVFPPPLKK